jgi:hypothetical protein
MSLINDALKQARKAPPRSAPSALPPLQPTADEDSPVAAWLLSAIVILLIVAAIFFIGWAVAHHTVRSIVAAPDPAGTQAVTEVSLPAPAPRPVEVPEPVNPPDAPKLQAIFYMPNAPSAILDGKTVRPGDKFRKYRVKEITKYTVTLIDQDGKPVKLGMGN